MKDRRARDMSQFIISGFSDEINKNINIQFETLKRLGIDYFEVRGVNGKNIAKLDESELTELKEDMKAFGIKASCIGSPIGKALITEDFEPHFDKFKWVVHIAKTLETKYIRIFSFFLPQGDDWSAYRGEVIRRLSQMVAYAKEQDVILLHENEKDIYGETAERCLELFIKVNSPNFKAIFDPANFVQCGENLKEAFTTLKPYIEYMHIKDAIEEGTVVPAGCGIGEVEFILKELKANGYQGFLSLEPHLGAFEGLQELELNDKMMKLKQSSKESFVIAYDALQEILERI